MRTQFIQTATELLDDDPRTALVLADISVAGFAPAARRHPDRVVNVGIREQLMVGVAGGLALTGLRPIAHSYAPFLVERPYEQVKLDLGYQGVGAILVSIGASYDASEEGRTHQSPGDVALIDSVSPQWMVYVPGHADEVAALLREAVRHDEPVYIRLSSQSNTHPHMTDGRLVTRKVGAKAAVVAVGPMLDPVLDATRDLDVTVAYTNAPRPFDVEGLRALDATDLVLVEPYLTGTSAHVVETALRHVPHRLLSLGVPRGAGSDLRRYGQPADHARAHGLDAAGLRAAITDFLDL
jgi:transketolase